MIDTGKYENMRQLFLDFIESASDEVDEEAWRDKLTMLDELLAEVKRLGQENKKIEGFLFDSHATRKKAMSLAIILDEQLIRAAEWARAKVNGDQEKVDAFWDYIEEE